MDTFIIDKRDIYKELKIRKLFFRGEIFKNYISDHINKLEIKNKTRKSIIKKNYLINLNTIDEDEDKEENRIKLKFPKLGSQTDLSSSNSSSNSFSDSYSLKSSMNIISLQKRKESKFEEKRNISSKKFSSSKMKNSSKIIENNFFFEKSQIFPPNHNNMKNKNFEDFINNMPKNEVNLQKSYFPKEEKKKVRKESDKNLESLKLERENTNTFIKESTKFDSYSSKKKLSSNNKINFAKKSVQYKEDELNKNLNLKEEEKEKTFIDNNEHDLKYYNEKNYCSDYNSYSNRNS